jgi:hypothetical protein
LKALRDELRILKEGGPGGTSGGMATADPIADQEKRIWRLETGVVTAFLFLIAAIGGLYLYIGTKTDGLGGSLASVEVSTGKLDERTQAINQRLDSMDKKLDTISDKLDRPRK